MDGLIQFLLDAPPGFFTILGVVVSGAIAWLVAHRIARRESRRSFDQHRLRDIYPATMKEVTKMQRVLTNSAFPSVNFSTIYGSGHRPKRPFVNLRWWIDMTDSSREFLLPESIRRKLSQLENTARVYWDLWDPARDVVLADLRPRYSNHYNGIPPNAVEAEVLVMSDEPIPFDAQDWLHLPNSELQASRDAVGNASEVVALRTQRDEVKRLVDEVVADLREHIERAATRLEKG